MMYSVWMPNPDGTAAVAVTVQAAHRGEAYDKAMDLTGAHIAGAKVFPVLPPPGAYDLKGRR
jgi:hypothetical protein